MSNDETGVVFLERDPEKGGTEDIDPEEGEKEIKPSSLIKDTLGERRPLKGLRECRDDQEKRWPASSRNTTSSPCR
jgi:hypothetical protein